MMPTLTPTNLKLWQTLQFLIRLLILSAPLYLVIALSLDLTLLQNWFASLTALVLSAAGWDVLVAGSVVSVTAPAQFTFMIVRDCTAWKSILFLFALIFAMPRKREGVRRSLTQTKVLSRSDFLLRERIPGFLLGIPIIALGNLVRIVTSVWVQSVYGQAIAGLVHNVLWQFGLIALVLVIWYAWLRKAYKPSG